MECPKHFEAALKKFTNWTESLCLRFIADKSQANAAETRDEHERSESEIIIEKNIEMLRAKLYDGTPTDAISFVTYHQTEVGQQSQYIFFYDSKTGSMCSPSHADSKLTAWVSVNEDEEYDVTSVYIKLSYSRDDVNQPNLSDVVVRPERNGYTISTHNETVGDKIFMNSLNQFNTRFTQGAADAWLNIMNGNKPN